MPVSFSGTISHCKVVPEFKKTFRLSKSRSTDPDGGKAKGKTGSGASDESEHTEEDDYTEDLEDNNNSRGRPTSSKKGKLSKPPMYKVLMFKDEYTTMDFIVKVLEIFFKYEHSSAVRLMLEVHNSSVATVGVFTHEVAEMRVLQVADYSAKNQQPLKLMIEEV